MASENTLGVNKSSFWHSLKNIGRRAAYTLQYLKEPNEAYENSKTESDSVDAQSQQDHSAHEDKEQEIILPPGKLKVDNDLNLSRDNFGQSIKGIIGKHKTKDKLTFDPLAEIGTYPTPGVLEKFASLVYKDKYKNEFELDYDKRLNLPDGWKLLIKLNVIFI